MTGIAFGGDYNPEQWTPEVWDEDVRLMKVAGVTLVTVGVFSWARLEPRPGEFDFGWLDTVLDTMHAAGVCVDLATATASPPPWFSSAFPESLPVTRTGVRLSPGSRQAYCPSSPVYRESARALARRMADRYGRHPAVRMWHVNNEYGCHVARCYCDISADAFRRWLEDKYGDVGALNRAWGTTFWSQQYSDFAEVLPPRETPTFGNPTQALDFDRFSTDELLACFRLERDELHAVTPHLPVTTNFMGAFEPVDYWRWADEVDVVSDDLYTDPADPRSAAFAAHSCDLMRSLGGGAPWILMEQAPSAVNWRRRNAAKAVGENRALSIQAVARGADAILHFQWRQSVHGAEKFHSGLLPHMGEHTRVFREARELGADLARLASVEGQRVRADVAVLFDWESWWALGQPASPTAVDYLEVNLRWYEALWRHGVAVDFVAPGNDTSPYRLVVAPAQFVMSDAAEAELAAVVERGDVLAVTFQSGILDPDLRIRHGGYLGRLQTTLGVRVEEFDPPAGHDLERTGAAPTPALTLSSSRYGTFEALVWSELLHATDSEPVAEFTAGIAAGSPAVTRRVPPEGRGAAWYVATLPEPDALDRIVDDLLVDAGLRHGTPSPTLERVRRGDVRFVINHGPEPAAVDDPGHDLLGAPPGVPRVVPPKGVLALVDVTSATQEEQ